MRKTGFGALACAALMACGGSSHKSTLPVERNVQMPPEEFTVQAPSKPFKYEMDEDVIEGEVYRPEAERDPVKLAAPSTPLPKGKPGKDLKTRRAAFAKAKSGKDKVKQAEWLAVALVAAAAAGELAADDAWKEARAALDAAVADAAAGETTWQMAAVAREATKDAAAAGEAWQKLVTGFATSSHIDEYRIALSSTHFATPAARKQAVTDLTEVATATWWTNYVRAWALIDDGDDAGALPLLRQAMTAATGTNQRRVRADWLHTLAWTGGDPAHMLSELADTRAMSAQPLADLITVANYLADKGDLVDSATLFGEVLKDPTITPTQIDHAYEVRTQEALAGRRLADLASEVEALLEHADKYPPGDDAERAVKVASLIAGTIHAEWATTHEDPAAAAAKRMYAAVMAHPALSKSVDVSKNARDLDEQMKAKEVPQGEPDKALIRRVIRLNWNGMRHCYEVSLAKNPELKGNVEATFSPAADGANTVSDLQKVDLSDGDGACIKTAIETWRFPSHSKRAVITVVARFKFVPTAP